MKATITFRFTNHRTGEVWEYYQAPRNVYQTAYRLSKHLARMGAIENPDDWTLQTYVTCAPCFTRDFTRYLHV